MIQTKQKPKYKRIRRKLLTAFLTIALLGAIIGVVGYNSNVSISKLYQGITDEVAPKLIALEKVDTLSNKLLATAISFSLVDSKYKTLSPEEELAKFEKTNQELDQILEILDNIEGEEDRIIKDIRPAKENLYNSALALINSKQEGNLEDIATQRETLEAVEREFEEVLSLHLFEQSSEVDSKSASANESSSRSTLLTLLISLIIFSFAIFLGFFISKSISRPIEELMDATRKLEKGDTKVKVEIRTKDELEHLGDTFNQMIKVLDGLEEERKQLDRAKTEFLSITSHELRSPMAPMRAQLQMIMEDYYGEITKEQREALDIVLRNTKRLDRIIQDLLEVSRIEAARLKFKFVKTDLTKHILRLKQEMDGFLPEKKIELVTNLGKLPIIEVDPDRTMQVLRNLINNAKKFSKENSKIYVNAILKNNMIEISVKDTGAGIAKENIKKIFEPFFQEEQTFSRKHKGTGLGLAICRGIVESQHGRFWVTSTQGKGATFSFTIPLKPERKIAPIKLLFSSQKKPLEK